jgi:formate dehydrogenase iron-sulfur subunit
LRWAMLYDSNLCVGCKLCESACAGRNGLPYNDSIAEEEKTSAHKLTAIIDRDDEYMRRMCMHCLEPTCVSVCPVGALQKTAEGPVIYQADRCMGCRYCMLACPFGVPKYEWDELLPVVRKCDMCADRLADGNPPACVAVCPTGATIVGDRDELLEEARRRIQEEPSLYVDHVYGSEEVGGTSVLLLAGKPIGEFQLPDNLQTQPLPILTHRVLSRIPDLVLLGGALLGGIWWLTNRRDEVAAAEGKPPRERKNTRGEE